MVEWTPRPAVMLLGPSKSLPNALSCVEDFNAARHGVAVVVRELAPALIMEDEPNAPGEGPPYTKKFHRLVREHDVRTFAVLWPLHAQMNALDVELGFLLDALEAVRLQPDDVQLLVERADPERDLREDKGEVVLALDERGNRGSYYQDFAAYGCPMRRWGTKAGLVAQAASLALDHALRYPVSVRT